MDDDIMGEMSKEDLLKVGFVLGNATKFIKAFAALSSAGASSAGPAPSSHFAAGGGAAALVHDLASLALSPSPPIPAAAAGIARTLASSNFKVIYERTVAPQFQDQVQTLHPSPPTPPHLTPVASCSSPSGCCWSRTARHGVWPKQWRYPSSRTCSGSHSNITTSCWTKTRWKLQPRVYGRRRRRCSALLAAAG